MRIAARHADGWMIWDKSDDRAHELQAAFRTVCDAESRSHDEIEHYRAGVVIRFNGAVGVPWSTNSPLEGSAEAVAEALIEKRDAGFTSILVWPDPNNLAGIDAMARILEIVNAA
jgi:alkanesulfonate monooxygenase SsuD/methylene tetrahydromethanopterin reductase-like flavin-dependent oxidoreductase (luciferase family)